MDRRFASWFLVPLALGVVATANRIAAADDRAQSRPPNVILILVDDLGWTDLSCQGSTFYETPHIDRLAKEGMRFTHGYAACTVCSPTRAAVLTGKYPARLQITDWIAGHQRPFAKLKPPDWTQFLPHEETTIAELLKAKGYATFHVGKWHLGSEAYWPTTHGFDENIGGNHRGQPPSYFFPYGRDAIKLPGLATGANNEYLTDRLTDESLRIIDANKDRPFFLYLPHYTVHTPLQAKADKIVKYRTKTKPDQPQQNATYAAMIESLDESIGRIMQKLDELQLADNTLVIFTSDNGGLVLNQVTSNVPLRAGKGSAYEGGVRVPLIVRYPPLVKPGSICEVPAMSIDLAPTIAELAGVNNVPPIDGVSLVPVLEEAAAALSRPTLYWHYPHYHPGGATPYGAIRDGQWRLIEFFEDGKVELYNLAEDIGEASDLATKNPEKRSELLEKLRAWRKEVAAQMPLTNPAHDPSRAAEPAGGKGKNKKK
ncbi:MAG TPA: sulfatase [Pirellulaceae bacterium]|nr:sulfatase [Pirellulaceae bacterium]